MSYEERMSKALAALDLQEHPKYAPVAREYSLERTTLAKRHKGQTTSRAIANSESRQCLTTQQEEALITAINFYTDRHIPPTSQMVKNFAEEIIGRSVGKNWTSGFVHRHESRLKSVYLCCMDNKRTKAEFPPLIGHFFQLVSKYYT